MTKAKSIISAVPKAPQNDRPKVTIIAQATDKWPHADPDPTRHIARIADSIRKMADHLDSVYALTGLNEESPVVMGAGIFLNEITERLRKDAEFLCDINSTMTVQTEGAA